jgi:hypothetical protein
MPIHYRILWACLVMACTAMSLGGAFVGWCVFTDPEVRTFKTVGAFVLAAIVAAGVAVIVGMP